MLCSNNVSEVNQIHYSYNPRLKCSHTHTHTPRTTHTHTTHIHNTPTYTIHTTHTRSSTQSPHIRVHICPHIMRAYYISKYTTARTTVLKRHNKRSRRQISNQWNHFVRSFYKLNYYKENKYFQYKHPVSVRFRLDIRNRSGIFPFG